MDQVTSVSARIITAQAHGHGAFLTASSQSELFNPVPFSDIAKARSKGALWQKL